MFTINLYAAYFHWKKLVSFKDYFSLVMSRKYRSSRPDVFCEKGVVKNFAKFTGKHLCLSLFFNKVAGAASNLLQKRLWHRCFPVNFVKFLRTLFLIEHLWWLLLERVTTKTANDWMNLNNYLMS